MLYVFYGTDIVKSVEKARALVNSLRAKREDATFIEATGDNWDRAVVDENIGGQGLFSSKYIVFLNRVTENADAKETLAELVPAMAESTNIFIVSESKPAAELKKAFEKSAEKIVVTDEAEKAAKKEEFNIFALGDALGSRDRFKAWSVYRQAVESGAEPEGVLGTLFWQAKSIAVAAAATTPAESGLSPFVYSKSKKYAGNFKEGEIQGLLHRLITLYHDGHRGLTDLELGIESFLLKI